MVRRLTVLSSSADEDERPAWQWTVIGVLFVFAIWAPLAVAGTWVTGRLIDRVLGAARPEELPRLVAEAPPAMRTALWLASTATPMATYALACWASGALIGRFGARITTRRAAWAGALASIAGAGLSLLQSSWVASLAAFGVLLPLGTLTAWLGGRFGIRLRNQAFTRAPPPPVR
jgi:prepilin signal peptidase PulO-like enzyme (type II secretory pathway)